MAGVQVVGVHRVVVQTVRSEGGRERADAGDFCRSTVLAVFFVSDAGAAHPALPGPAPVHGVAGGPTPGEAVELQPAALRSPGAG